jgi:hypothetical protein
MKRHTWLIGLLLAALGGCGSYTPTAVQAGQTEAEVLQRMGPPTGRYVMPHGGSRLEYARGPAGRDTYMIDLDATGHVTGWQQVLTEAQFDTITPGLPRDEVLRRLGRPSELMPIPRQHLTVWNYRYFNHDCLWFQVSVGDGGQVVEAGHGRDRACDAPDHGDR